MSGIHDGLWSKVGRWMLGGIRCIMGVMNGIGIMEAVLGGLGNSVGVLPVMVEDGRLGCMEWCINASVDWTCKKVCYNRVGVSEISVSVSSVSGMVGNRIIRLVVGVGYRFLHYAGLIVLTECVSVSACSGSSVDVLDNRDVGAVVNMEESIDCSVHGMVLTALVDFAALSTSLRSVARHGSGIFPLGVEVKRRVFKRVCDVSAVDAGNRTDGVFVYGSVCSRVGGLHFVGVDVRSVALGNVGVSVACTVLVARASCVLALLIGRRTDSAIVNWPT